MHRVKTKGDRSASFLRSSISSARCFYVIIFAIMIERRSAIIYQKKKKKKKKERKLTIHKGPRFGSSRAACAINLASFRRELCEAHANKSEVANSEIMKSTVNDD